MGNSGAELTITGQYGFVEGIDLNVKPGGRLILDGGVLTDACGIWNGVDVWGHENLSQYPTSNQGYMMVIHGGKIQNAIYGIQLANVVVDTSYVRGSTGGIVRCDSAVFRNNETDVMFFPFMNTNPGTGEQAPNMSYIKNSYFLTGSNFCTPSVHVKLWDVDGINFKGCTFSNEVEYAECPFSYNKGIGIGSYNSGFYIEDYCASQTNPCTRIKRSIFENLNYGIYALNSETSKYISIDTSVFINNYKGIYMSAVTEQSITQNEFILNDDLDFQMYSPCTPVSLYLEACTGYIVEENLFSNKSEISNTTGIHILNSGQDANEIYNNLFYGFYSGIIAVGENRDEAGAGLCIECNDFENGIADISIVPEEDEFGYPITGGTIGIAAQQGEDNVLPDGPAGNTFTLSDENDNYYNDIECGDINYIHHDQEQSGPKVIPDKRYNITLDESSDIYYDDKETACPSNLGSEIDPQIEMASMASENLFITAYEDTLSQYVDGGDTEGLNTDVQTSFPDEALEIRQELLGNSPYLSDTVMKTAISKENVLPNAMIRDVLVANPQSAKSNNVLNLLDSRNDPMPDYMMAEIMQGEDIYGAKELLGQQLARHRTQKGKAFNKLIRYYKSDTLNITASNDSIASIFENDISLSSQYKLAFWNLKHYDSLQTFSTLSNIPVNFDLNYKEQSIHALYEDLFEIQWEIVCDSNKIDSNKIQSLLDISNNKRCLPGILARNILINEGVIVYYEPVYLPDLYKSLPVEYNLEEPVLENSILKVFPNPAGAYFIAEYDIRGYEGDAIINVTDLHGKVFTGFHVHDKQNQIIISTESIPSGIYLVRLIINSGTIATEKLILSK